MMDLDKKEEIKGGKKSVKAIIITLSVVLVLIISGALVVNHYLNKIDFKDQTQLEIDPNEKIDLNLPDEHSGADNDLNANLRDNRLWHNDKVINILLIGLDTRNPRYYSRSDAMILLSINKVDKQIHMVSLLRAAYVSIPGFGKGRLNSAYSYGGANLLIKTIENNYKIKIDNFASVDFKAFQEIVDILGGVDIKLTEAELEMLKGPFYRANVDTSRGAGVYTLNGEAAVYYTKLRSIDTDRDRTQRQRNVLNQIAKKAKAMNVRDVVKLMDEILPYVKTDFSKTQLVAEAFNVPAYLKYPVKEIAIPTAETMITSSLVEIDGVEVLLLNWNKTKNFLHDLLYPNMEPEETLTQQVEQ